MVATNTYVERWKDTAVDLERYAFRQTPTVVIHLFTNQVDIATEFARANLKRIKVLIHEIEPWGWPEATLFRYKFFTEMRHEISEEFLVYLDSDMRLRSDPSEIIRMLSKSDGIGVVSHPGYFRPNGIHKIKLYFRNPSFILRDIKISIINSKNLGAWERNNQSNAFVKRRYRTSYVHGAVWFGFRENFLDMCNILSKRTQSDFENGLIASWHDESHLNWFITNYPHKTFDNRLSWVVGYQNLARYTSTYVITSVQKELGEGRTPTNA
jgi:hypothetical protein